LFLFFLFLFLFWFLCHSCSECPINSYLHKTL
jgi:hypothetical protein